MLLISGKALKKAFRTVLASLWLFAGATLPAVALSVIPVTNSDFIPLEVDSNGVVSEVFLNATGSKVRTVRFFFVPELEDPLTVIGAGVDKATEEEVILTGLEILENQEFELRITGLVPQQRFVISIHNESRIDPANSDDIAKIEALLSQINDPPLASPAPVPLPLPILMLGSGILLLTGLRRMQRPSEPVV